MKKKKSALLFTLALFSLFVLGGVLAFSFLKNNFPKEKNKIPEKDVLGELTEKIPQNALRTFLETKLQGTQKKLEESFSQKTKEIQTEIIKTIEKEAVNLTKSQIETLKLQICRDWGVFSLTPSPSP